MVVQFGHEIWSEDQRKASLRLWIAFAIIATALGVLGDRYVLQFFEIKPRQKAGKGPDEGRQGPERDGTWGSELSDVRWWWLGSYNRRWSDAKGQPLSVPIKTALSRRTALVGLIIAGVILVLSGIVASLMRTPTSYGSGEVYQDPPCSTSETKRAFFESAADIVEAPIVIHASVIGLLSHEDLRQERISNNSGLKKSRYGVLKIDWVVRGEIPNTPLLVNVSPSRCVALGENGFVPIDRKRCEDRTLARLRAGFEPRWHPVLAS